ncbi:hypothetical protein XccvBFoX6_gp63c [Xanthomonas phage FoX6]|uniref:Uncharacterized protein n=1 Tax=Xanthomonas phage FoX6 TaxID=2723902 RepID=A0A858NQ29_9CAUD|nr:hypothetical protein XccvBFoX6_gp63c [Xanthomonas phage FoX6]
MNVKQFSAWTDEFENGSLLAVDIPVAKVMPGTANVRLTLNGIDLPVGTPLYYKRESYQKRAHNWALEAVGPSQAADVRTRMDRFIEEAIELAQSTGYDRERIANLVEYVYGRPAGEPGQELGGVSITLACVAAAMDLNLEVAAETEYVRVNGPEVIERVRAKQHDKSSLNEAGPLPRDPEGSK